MVTTATPTPVDPACHGGLVGLAMRRYRHLPPDSRDEVEQELWVKLLIAARSYDPAGCAAFSTYAVSCLHVGRPTLDRLLGRSETPDGRLIARSSAFTGADDRVIDPFGCDHRRPTPASPAQAVADRVDGGDRISELLAMLGQDAKRLLAARVSVGTGEPIRAWTDAAATLGWVAGRKSDARFALAKAEIILAAQTVWGDDCPVRRGHQGALFTRDEIERVIFLRDKKGLSFFEIAQRFRVEGTDPKATVRKLYRRAKRGAVQLAAGESYHRGQLLDPAERARRVAAALELVAAGNTHEQAGAAVGLPRSTVGSEAKRASIGGRQDLMTPAIEEDIISRLRAGETYQAIALAVGCSASAVYTVATRHGLLRRSATSGGAA